MLPDLFSYAQQDHKFNRTNITQQTDLYKLNAVFTILKARDRQFLRRCYEHVCTL